MTNITHEELKKLKQEYPIGSRIELVHMDDPTAPPRGTLGTVIGIDDTGSIMVKWDNGSSLNVLWNLDKILKAKNINDRIISQIMEIRDSGETNMFDINVVQRLAFERNYFELVLFIEEHKKEYVNFIMYGKAESLGY